MRIACIDRLAAPYQITAPVCRLVCLLRSNITLGDIIAVGYFTPQLPLDYEFATDRRETVVFEQRMLCRLVPECVHCPTTMTRAPTNNKSDHPERGLSSPIAATVSNTRTAFTTATDPSPKQLCQASMTPALNSPTLLPAMLPTPRPKQTP